MNFKKSKTIAIIPARGGSKGIPRKNVRLLAGKPLICYTIERALESKNIDIVVVSTEDEEIAEVSKKCGAEIIKRPAELAEDKTPTIDVVFHALGSFEQNEYIDLIIVLIQPTSPLRNTKDIDSAIELFLNADCESVVSVCEVGHPPHWCFKIEEGYLKSLFGGTYLRMRRQDLEAVYMPNGAIYVSTPQTLYKYKSFYCNHTIPYIMPTRRSIDIDNEIDFMLAELLIKNMSLDSISNEAVRNFKEEDE